MTTLTRNTRLRIVRGFLHDLFCASGCQPGPGRDDHARRTQHESARAVVDGDWSTVEQLASVLHGCLCLAEIRKQLSRSRDVGCPDAPHLLRFEPVAERLIEELDRAADTH